MRPASPRATVSFTSSLLRPPRRPSSRSTRSTSRTSRSLSPSTSPAEVPINPTELANASPEEQKQIIGERLFFKIEAINAEQAGKITGMLLEMDNSELLILLDSPETLKAKVKEAEEVLSRHQAEAEPEAATA
eukprot:Colp12_sorted_trinity150504_noHs@14672